MRDWHLSSLAYGFKRVYWAVCASVFQNFKCPTKTEITNKTLMRLACARADTFQNLSIFQIGTSLSKCRAAYGAQVLLLQTQTQKQQQTNPSPNPQTYSAPQTVGLVLGCVDRRFNNVDRNLSAIFVIERLMYVGQKKSRFEMRLVWLDKNECCSTKAESCHTLILIAPQVSLWRRFRKVWSAGSLFFWD